MNTDGRTQSQLFICISLLGFVCDYCFVVVKKA